MRRQQLPILFFAILAVGCDNDDIARVIDPPALTTEEQIIADCYVVRDALEAFAAGNGGVFPLEVASVLPLLPGGTQLTNRYTGLGTVPVFHDAQWPGEIGVILLSDFLGLQVTPPPTGYRIVGRGRDDVLVRLENTTALAPRTVGFYDSVLANCETTVAAAEEFARQAGQCAGSVSGDALPNGDVMTDLLPGGWLLTNPSWGGQDSPVDGSANGAGNIGYSPQDGDGNGTWEGYWIDATGADGATTIAIRTRTSPENESVVHYALELRLAAEEFASANAGEYPRDLDSDETPSGDTLLELASCTGCGLLNPYTGAPAYRNGLATSRGEVGYVPLEYDGIVVGYVINALGLFNEELERFEVLTN